MVLARPRRRKGERHVCDRGDVVCYVEECASHEACGLYFTTMAFHPSYSGVRIEGINALPLIGVKYKRRHGLYITKNG